MYTMTPMMLLRPGSIRDNMYYFVCLFRSVVLFVIQSKDSKNFGVNSLKFSRIVPVHLLMS